MRNNHGFYFIKPMGSEWTIAKFFDKIDCFVTFDNNVYHWSEVEVSKQDIEFPVDNIVDYDRFLDEIFY